MNRALLFNRAILVAIVLAAFASQSFADPPDILRDYRFIPSHTTVHVSGGFPGYDMDLSIAGKFGLVTGYDYGTSATGIPTLVPLAQFVDVKAILFNPLSMAPLPLPGWELDKTLNLTGLTGTFEDPRVLQFSGVDGQGVPIALQAVLRGPLLHLTGANRPNCPGCADIIGYKVDAFAHLAPYADFNLDGTIDTTDLHLLMTYVGMESGASFDQGDADGDGDVDGGDFLVWQQMLGTATSLSEFSDAALASGSAVPEPTAGMLLLFAATWIALAGRAAYTPSRRTLSLEAVSKPSGTVPILRSLRSKMGLSPSLRRF